MRQRSFVRHYIECGNATRAAKQAGYSAPTARQAGSRLLSNVVVAQAIDSELQALAAAQGDTPGGIVAELHDLGTRAAEAGQFGPAVRATELRGRHLGMWQEVQGRNQSKITINIFDSSVDIGGSQDSHSDDDADVIEGELANPDAK